MRLPIYLCSEVVRELDFIAQCRLARASGYDGLELAPFTLADDPTQIAASRVAEYRAIAEAEGAPVAGLHWLMAAPQGLSITSSDAGVIAATREAGRRLVDLCAGLGGSYLVHGSPAQRAVEPGFEAEGRQRAAEYFAAMADAATRAGVRYLIEPLSRNDTQVVNTIEESLAIVEAVASPALGTMIDCYAAASNGQDIPALIDRWAEKGVIAHIHFNDADKRAPGQGPLDFRAILQALQRNGYAGAAAVEPFIYEPDGPASARQAIAHLRALERDLATSL